MAESGFPVQEISSYLWERGSVLLQDQSNLHGKELLLDGRPPRHGDIMTNPGLASTLKELATNGKKGFYEGGIAKAIIDTVKTHGGVLTLEDLSAHTSTLVDPISTDYKGRRVWELPPNGQGMAALIALNILEGIDLKALGHNTTLYLHIVIESLRLAFADTLKYCADLEHSSIPIDRLLSKKYAETLRGRIAVDRVIPASQLNSNILESSFGSDTVYFATVDKDGNACSFINSNFNGFGTGLVPEGCGFTLQNRGCCFSLNPNHANVLAPGKRPYHTIIPAMVTDATTGDLLMSYGVMGGYMQPQGHVQVLLNMLEFGYNPQEALDKPRFLLGDSHKGLTVLDTLFLEDGIDRDVEAALKSLGHCDVRYSTGFQRQQFGKGQVISRGNWWVSEDGGEKRKDRPRLYWAGSDPRGDGCVAAY